jgi:8-amino-7-oxononanoate synthase
MLKVVLQGPVGPEVRVGGKKYLYFGGSDYLGMASRPEVLEGAREALDLYGVSSSASRTSTGTNELHLRLEEALCAFTGQEAAVLCSAGYLSMRCLLEGVAAEGDRLLVQKDVHSSVREAARLSGRPSFDFEIGDPAGLAALVERLDAQKGRLLVLGEGVAPLMGTIFPAPEVLKILAGREALLLLDDAHSFGVLGDRGRGTAEHFGADRGQVLACATLSKAFGAFGGVVPADRALARAVRERSLAYICATPPPAPILGAALASVGFAAAHPDLFERLHRNALFLRAGLAGLGLNAGPVPVPICPLILESAQALQSIEDRLLGSGILAPVMNYPGSPSGGMIRLVVTAGHTPEQIGYLLDCLRKFI